jgi:GDP-L-fucose synthase
MRALVTGGTGFLGRHLVPYLAAQAIETVVLGSRSCDLTDRANLDRLAGERFDRIYHLAAWTQAGDFCLYHPGEQWIVNQLINTNVLWYWSERQPQATLIAIGTSCAYPPALPLREENYLAGEPDADLYTYAMTKRMLYQGLRALRKQYGLSYRYLVPSTLYGPGFDLTDSHFVFDLVRKIVRGREEGAPVVLWGDGRQVRELVHVRDAVRLIDLATERCPDDLLNLASGAGRTIREYAELICASVGYDPALIQYDRERYVGVSEKVLSTAKLRTIADFRFTDLASGIAEVVADYRARAAAPKSIRFSKTASRERGADLTPD